MPPVTEATTTPTTQARVIKPMPELDTIDFGGGRYSNLMKSIYSSSMTVFRLDWEHAKRVAEHCASEFGAIMKDVQVDVKVGKSDKGGRITLSEACKIKGIVATPELSLMRALQYANEAGLNGIMYQDTKWVPVSRVAELLVKLTPK